jgi:hypothetical protein
MAIYPDFADYSTFFTSDGAPDLDPSFTPIEGPRAVLEHVARRFITTPEQYDDENYGYDLTTYLNANVLGGEFAGLNARVRAEAIQVEGVEDAVVTATFVSGTLSVRVIVTLADDTEYPLVFVLTATTLPRVFFPVV